MTSLTEIVSINKRFWTSVGIRKLLKKVHISANVNVGLRLRPIFKNRGATYEKKHV